LTLFARTTRNAENFHFSLHRFNLNHI
jgi:hypothetical protein